MSDMLVKLYTLPPLEPVLAAQTKAGVEIRRVLTPGKADCDRLDIADVRAGLER